MPRLLTLAGLLGGVLLAGAAQAVMVDMTDGGWSQHNNRTTATRTYGSNQVTLSTNGTGSLSSTRYDGGQSSTAYGRLAHIKDGVGINDDEISYGKERLTASFSSAVTLNSVQFLDLFGQGPGDPLAEGAAMLINFAGDGSETLTAFGTDLSKAGYLDYAVGLTNILSISFFTDADVPNSDFALAALDLDWADDDNLTGVNDPDLKDPRGPASLLQQPPAQSVAAPDVLWLMLIGLILIGATGARRSRCLSAADR